MFVFISVIWLINAPWHYGLAGWQYGVIWANVGMGRWLALHIGYGNFCVYVPCHSYSLVIRIWTAFFIIPWLYNWIYCLDFRQLAIMLSQYSLNCFCGLYKDMYNWTDVKFQRIDWINKQMCLLFENYTECYCIMYIYKLILQAVMQLKILSFGLDFIILQILCENLWQQCHLHFSL